MTSFDGCRNDLIAAVDRIVSESGDLSRVDSDAWSDDWLIQPLPALGGVTPRSYIHSGRYCQDIRGVLLMAQSGAFA